MLSEAHVDIGDFVKKNAGLGIAGVIDRTQCFLDRTQGFPRMVGACGLLCVVVP